MDLKKIKRAIISVSNKSNLKKILPVLKKFKIEIISSGGTYREIKKMGYDCIEVSNYTKDLINEYNIDCDLTGNCNYDVAPHPSYFNGIKEEAEIYKKEFGIETEVFSKEEFNEIGHEGNEQYGAMSYTPGFAINPLKFLLGLANEANKSGYSFLF